MLLTPLSVCDLVTLPLAFVFLHGDTLHVDSKSPGSVSPAGQKLHPCVDRVAPAGSWPTWAAPGLTLTAGWADRRTI